MRKLHVNNFGKVRAAFVKQVNHRWDGSAVTANSDAAAKQRL